MIASSMVYGKQLVKKSSEKGSITIWGSNSYSWKKKIRKEEIVAFQKIHPASFLEKEKDFGPLFNFCKVISEGFDYVLFFSRREVAEWIKNFLELGGLKPSGCFLIFDDTQEDLLFELRESLNGKSVLLVFLGRKNDEFKLLPFVFSFNEWEKAFVGVERGIFAEIARLAFCPFFPAKLERGSFWHYSEFLYIPLCCAGLKMSVHELEESFWWMQEAGKEATIFCALLLYSFIKSNCRIFFVVEDSFSFNLVSGLRPLFERISWGEKSFFLQISDLQQFGETFLETVDKGNECLVFFIRRENTSSGFDLQIKFPNKFRSSPFWESVFSPFHRKTYHHIKNALFASLEEFLLEKNIPYTYLLVEGEPFFSAGVLGSFLQDLACYLGFLNGVNLLEELHPSFWYRNFWQHLQDGR
ncbi:MAG: hypothetical protein J7J32_02765 [Candidatus Atribacteria bacterium]|nr:hypothetical protein [Candidatus Atribacteria bacterium]MCD6350290.1 hypothetical protein [Candidatus Atribacteria bacterium]